MTEPCGIYVLVNLYMGARAECAQAIKANPRNGSSYVRDQEAPPRHVMRACKEADNAAKHRNEAGEEDNFGAVAQEKILSNLDPRRVQVKIGAVPQQQPISKLTADPKCDQSANDPAEDARKHDGPNTQLMRRACVDGRRNKDSFPR